MKRSSHEIKKIIIFCILIFSIIFISEASTEKKNVLKDDGTDWTNLTDSTRLTYVMGLLAGVEVVRGDMYVFRDKIKSEGYRESYNMSLNRTSLVGITVGQLRDGMDAFYNDFSNRRIKMVDAIYIVKMQIKGEDPELIDSQIRYLKMQPINTEIVFEYQDKYIAFCKKKGSSLTYKDIKNGDFSVENLIRAAMFIDASNNLHILFRFGRYK